MADSSNMPILDHDGDPADAILLPLMEAHPLLFRSRLPAVDSQVRVGGYALADELYGRLEADLGAAGCATVKVRPVKEKFAGLCFHLRERSAATVEELPSEETIERVRELIGEASGESERTSQERGQHGAVHNVDGHLVTLYEPHHRATNERQL